MVFYFYFCQGTDSPQAVRKLMSLSEPPKTRRKNPNHNHNHHHSSGSTGSSNQQHDSKSPAAGRKQVRVSFLSLILIDVA